MTNQPSNQARRLAHLREINAIFATLTEPIARVCAGLDQVIQKYADGAELWDVDEASRAEHADVIENTKHLREVLGSLSASMEHTARVDADFRRALKVPDDASRH